MEGFASVQAPGMGQGQARHEGLGGHTAHPPPPLLPFAPQFPASAHKYILHVCSILLPWLCRGDASRLPPERLGLCEVEAFRQTEAGSSCWCPDDLASPAFCHLDDLRPIPVAAYDARFDRWTIEEVLPDGCAGPDLPEEIIL